MADLLDGHVPLVVRADAWACGGGVVAAECDVDRGLHDVVAGEGVSPVIPVDRGQRLHGRPNGCDDVLLPDRVGVSVRYQHVTGGAGALSTRVAADQLSSCSRGIEPQSMMVRFAPGRACKAPLGASARAEATGTTRLPSSFTAALTPPNTAPKRFVVKVTLPAIASTGTTREVAAVPATRSCSPSSSAATSSTTTTAMIPKIMHLVSRKGEAWAL